MCLKRVEISQKFEPDQDLSDQELKRRGINDAVADGPPQSSDFKVCQSNEMLDVYVLCGKIAPTFVENLFTS